jgi:cell division protein FtsB
MNQWIIDRLAQNEARSAAIEAASLQIRKLKALCRKQEAEIKTLSEQNKFLHRVISELEEEND